MVSDWVDESVVLLSDRKNPNSGFDLVNDHERSRCEIGLVLPQGGDHDSREVIRQHVGRVRTLGPWACVNASMVPKSKS
jgi:hypothetical protein